MNAPRLKNLLSRRPLKYTFVAIALLLVGVAGWWMAGRKVWTDGQSGPNAIRVFTADEDPRQVLWTPSRAVLLADFDPGVGPEGQVYEPAISPDGTELFFVRGKAGLPVGDVTENHQPLTTGADIYVSRRRNNAWLAPERLDAVSSRYDDLGPRMTADGRFLLFYSNRPGGQGGYDLWAASRDDDGKFGRPVNLGSGVNSEFDEYGPAPSADGKRLYFSTNRTAAGKEQHSAWRSTIRAATTSDFDLWSADLAEVAAADREPTTERATPPDVQSPDRDSLAPEVAATKPAVVEETTPPAHAPRPRALQATGAREVPGVNTTFHEGAPCISSAGDFLYFASNRTAGHGRFDLYRSRFIQGMASAPENLGPSVNTADNETDPQLAHGGFKLYYSSDRSMPTAEKAGEDPGAPGLPGDASDAVASGPSPATRPAQPLSDVAAETFELAENRGPGYSIYEADSREVYPERQGRPLPVIGWKLLAMILAALLLLPLLLFFVRNINHKNLTLLQRCFMAALCVYALFLLWTTSKHVMMEAYPALAADLGFVEVKINLDPRIEESNVAMAIRQQSTTDLPVAAAPAGQLTQQAVGGEVIEALPDVAVNVPQAAVGGDAMSVVVAPPKIESPPAAAPAVSMVSPVVAPTPQPVDVKIDPGQRLQQAEAAPMIQPPPAPAAAQSPVAPQRVRPAPVAMPDLPSVQPDISVGTLAQSIGPAALNVPQVEPARVAVAAAPAPGATPAINVPAPAGNRALANEPAVAQVGAPIAPTVRVAEATPAAASPAATAIKPALPPSIADAVSLTDAPAPTARPMPIPALSSGTVQVEPQQQTRPGGAGVATSTPMPSGHKIAGVDPSIPAAASAPVAAAAERLASTASSDSAPAAGVQTAIPAAGAGTGGATGSLAAAPGVGARRSPDSATALAGVAPNLPAGDLVRTPEVTGPEMNTTPVAGGGAQTPAIAGPQDVGLSRQNAPTGELAGGAGGKSSLLPKLPTAGGGTPSMAGKVGPADAASAVAHINGPRASVAPDAASAAVATSAGVGKIAVRQPTTRSTAVEASLADAASDGAAGAMQPTTRPTGPAIASAAPEVSMTAPMPTAVPAAGAVAAPANGSAATLAPAPVTQPAGAAIAAAGVRVTGPAVGDPAGSAARVSSQVQITAPKPTFGQVASVTPQISTAPLAMPGAAKAVAILPETGPGGAGVAGVAMATPATPDVQGKEGGSIAPASVVAARNVVAQPALPAPSIAGAGLGEAIAGIEGPQMGLPKVAAMPTAGSGQGSPAGTGAVAGGGPDGDRIAATKADGSGPAIQRPVDRAMAGLPGVAPRVGQGGVSGPVAIAGPRPGISVTPGVGISPNISVAAPKLAAPEALFQRSVEQRRPMIEKLGGTKESEDAVERGLAWLARNQEPDGRWTYITSGGKKSKSTHDMALTGLSVLAFLAADHSPAKEGPYQQTVASAVEWLVSQQTEDGDLRGVKALRGAGSARANMYDHGIATMAVAEAALMTGDRRYMDAAFRAADFICDTQNKKVGGWRYLPGESGDTSVFGWQILALHNAELLGFQTPPQTRELAVRFLSLVSSGKTKILAGYTPGQGPTPPMTAEALFCRVLLDQPVSDAQAKEVVEFLGRDRPTTKNKDLYYWYYMSLSMAQLQANPQVRQAWDKWNQQCRDALIESQARGGDNDGSWTDSRFGEQAQYGAGKVFSTALATLTLEVYYRYLPLDMAGAEPPAARPLATPVPPAANPAKTVRPRGPVGPKFEPN